MLSLEIAILSEPGGRAYNEDACGYWSSERQFCCILADGAGGHGGGDIASRLAVQSLLTGFAAAPSASGPELSLLMRQTNQAVRDGRVAGTAQQDMHTTAVCLVIDFFDGRADWAHSGDSRLYWFRGARLVERTRDHSFVESLVDAGVLREEQTRSHPERSVLLSAFGKQDDELELSASLSSRVLDAGDVFLLCSDGVWEYLTDAQLEALLARARTAQEWLDSIEQAIRAATAGLASHDNYTALAVWLAGASEVQAHAA
ncbi:MAG: PP2C family serine/threonine-protein phosphatase [Burkholderiaceae bacterium]